VGVNRGEGESVQVETVQGMPAESTDDDIEKCPSYTKVLRFTFVAKPFLTQVAPLQILPSAVR
jgi:hypothetical protein